MVQAPTTLKQVSPDTTVCVATVGSRKIPTKAEALEYLQLSEARFRGVANNSQDGPKVRAASIMAEAFARIHKLVKAMSEATMKEHPVDLQDRIDRVVSELGGPGNGVPSDSVETSDDQDDG